MGFRSLRVGENRTDHDHGTGDQRRRLQVRHASAELHGSRRQTGTHPTCGPEGLRDPRKAHVPIHQDQELRCQRIRTVVRALPGVQVPRLDGSTLPVHHTDMPVPVPGSMFGLQRHT